MTLQGQRVALEILGYVCLKSPDRCQSQFSTPLYTKEQERIEVTQNDSQVTLADRPQSDLQLTQK